MSMAFSLLSGSARTPAFTSRSALCLNAAYRSQRRQISTVSSSIVAPLITDVVPYTVQQGPTNCAWQSLAYAQACTNYSKPDYMKSIMSAVSTASTSGMLDDEIDERNAATSELKQGYKHLKWGTPSIEEVENAVDRFGAVRLKGLGLTAPGSRFAPTSFHCVVVKDVLTIDGQKLFLIYDPEGKPNTSEWERLLVTWDKKPRAELTDEDYINADSIKDLYRIERAEDFLSSFNPRIGFTDRIMSLLQGDRDGMSTILRQ